MYGNVFFYDRKWQLGFYKIINSDSYISPSQLIMRENGKKGPEMASFCVILVDFKKNGQ